MTDEEFRRLYCWLVERMKPSAEVVARVLRNVLAALNQNQSKYSQERIAQRKSSGAITQKQHYSDRLVECESMVAGKGG